uniref:Uncharacterized protein AlNc14C257G9746 n=1 Tax=Albugo laibachii Nc14 TaxID=890382 RepID=F0WTS1_9STRA|nr:conserved hypothetical protein [Albugo laibachii Nc14]|eukprot:CCA24764.1 conserved hypothetical protein [Albugo laibachii Nc14]
MAEQPNQPPTSASASPCSRSGATQSSFNVPNVLVAELTVKIGDVHRTSRKHLSITNFQFSIDDGYENFCRIVNNVTTREIRNFEGPEDYVREDMAIYIRPGVHSKQSELVEVTARNFESRISRSYRNYLKRKVGNDGFKCDILTYVKKPSAISKRQRQDERTQQSTPSSFYPYSSQGSRQQVPALFASMHDVTAATMPPARRLQVSGLSLPQTMAPSIPSDEPYIKHQQQSEGTVESQRPGRPFSGAGPSSHSGIGVDVSGTSQRLSSLSTSSPPSVAKRKRSEAESWQPPVPPIFPVGTVPAAPHHLRQLARSSFTSVPDDDIQYRSIRMILNGSIVSVDVNVRDLFLVLEVARMQQGGGSFSSGFSHDEPDHRRDRPISSSAVASSRV